jgi:tetratricopeptide (TPR) repeat protein
MAHACRGTPPCLSQAAIAADPTFEHAYNNKANALKDMGRFEEAVQCYQKVSRQFACARV